MSWKQRSARLSGVILALYIASGSPVRGAEPFLKVDGEVSSPFTLTEAEFRALPRNKAETAEAPGVTAVYEGVALEHLLVRAGVLLREQLKGADVAKFVHTQGHDGFVAVFALPEFDAGTYLIADTKNGSRLPAEVGPLQLVSPTEMRHSRWVKGLVSIQVRRSNP